MSNTQHVKVEAGELQLGMYVARLDRPWTETPFLFQGFYIHSQDDIEELRRHCQYVFVDPAQGGSPTKTGDDHTITNVTSLRYPTPRQSSAGATRNRTVYTVATPVEQEMQTARTAHAEAGKAIQEILSTLEQGGQLNVELARQTVAPMVESVLRNPDAMIWLHRMKQHSAYIYQHSVGCSIWGIAFARHLGLDRVALQEVGLGCMLFDVGKTRLPASLLAKPGPLSTTEAQVARNHVDYSIAILENSSGITRRVLDMVHSHHERHDGSGYPDQLKGNQIPTFAKIAGMVDCYDAITSLRPYARQRSPYEAVREIYGWRGTLFQNEVVEQFMQVVGAFPTGSLVELNSGAVGIVIAQNETRRLRPRLMLVLDEKKRRLRRFETMDLQEEGPHQDPAKFWIERCLEPGAHGIDPQELYL